MLSVIQGQVKAILIAVFRKQTYLALSFQVAHSCKLFKLFISPEDKETCNYSVEMQGYFFIFLWGICSVSEAEIINALWGERERVAWRSMELWGAPVWVRAATLSPWRSKSGVKVVRATTLMCPENKQLSRESVVYCLLNQVVTMPRHLIGHRYSTFLRVVFVYLCVCVFYSKSDFFFRCKISIWKIPVAKWLR